MKNEFIKIFRETLRAFDREISIQNNASCCNGISLAQCHTLLEVEKNREISVSDLAKKLSLDKSTVSRTVDGLVNINLVDRAIPKENRRLALIQLTGSGKELCANINYNNDSYVSHIFSDFSDEEKENFLNLFSSLTAKMEAIRLKKNL
jgi:DNA-binding MarR family transcriptional regulator